MATSKQYGLGEFDFPRGWFMIAESGEATKKPVSLRYFGQDLIMYRGESNRVVVMEAYCPHMGTHLAKNQSSYVVQDGDQISGDSIRCPYHGWRFGPDGKCEEIPYSPAPIPEKACIKSWETREWGNCIFVWNDPENGEPDYDLPELKEWDDPAWVHWKIDQLGVLDQHPQEIIDNITDKAHLEPVHGSVDIEYFEGKFDKHTVHQNLAAGHRTLANETLYNKTWYTGPGILMSYMDGAFPSLMLITNTPIEDGVTRVWHALLVKSQNEKATEEDVGIARAYQEASCAAVSQDLDIWQNKKPCLQIMQVIGDGPFNRVRTWYKQFYNPRAQAKSFQEKVNGDYITKGTKRDAWEEKGAAE